MYDSGWNRPAAQLRTALPTDSIDATGITNVRLICYYPDTPWDWNICRPIDPTGTTSM